MGLQRLNHSIPELKKISTNIREHIIVNSHRSNTPHLASCLSVVDILTVLYFKILRLNLKDFSDPARDRFILSKGHAAPALFQTMKFRSFFESDRLDDYGQNGSIFGEHPPSPSELNGIEAATGSLGHGLPIGIGMALAERYNNKDYRVFVLLGDGECNEGTIWESALFASAKKLNNLITIIDCNRWQATGRTKEIIELAPFQDKWKAFGWDTTVINGHDLEELKISLSEKSTHSQRPLAVIANTIKGKGVSFMEDDNNWHYKIPTTDEVNQALQELKTSTRRVEHEK